MAKIVNGLVCIIVTAILTSCAGSPKNETNIFVDQARSPAQALSREETFILTNTIRIEHGDVNLTYYIGGEKLFYAYCDNSEPDYRKNFQPALYLAFNIEKTNGFEFSTRNYNNMTRAFLNMSSRDECQRYIENFRNISPSSPRSVTINYKTKQLSFPQ